MRKMSIVTLKKKHIAVILVCVLVVAFSIATPVVNVLSSKSQHVIVIDAGHGGRDGGSVGVNGTIEKTINLEYAFALKEKLVKHGFKVKLTRENDDGLYRADAINKKASDMNERFKIIKNTNPNLLISIHMNSFVSGDAKGALTYFRKGDKASEQCADLIQKSITTYCPVRQARAKVGDFYMLNCSYYTAVLIECGFLSNPEEEALLNTQKYKELMTDAIAKGIILYFGNKFI